MSGFHFPYRINNIVQSKVVYFRFTLFICLLIAVSIRSSSAQVAQQNIGFETGTFSGWTGATGQCCPVYAPNSGIDTARHVIVSGFFSDPHSNGLVPVVSPNSIYSARLGNENNSAESEILEYSFTVPSDSLVLKIHYAVLLENGLHPVSKQSRFAYSVSSANSPLQGCTEVSIIAGEQAPDTILNGDLEIYFWQSRFVDLIGHIGENISMKFETGDCGPGGHFGYAYIDCELLDASLKNSGCNFDGSITINKNAELNGNWFDGTNGNIITIQNPSLNDDYFLELNSGTDCSFKIPIHVDHQLPFVNFSTDTQCQQSVSFNNFSQFTSGATLIWDFDDGNSSSSLSPTNQYQLPGNYIASLTISQINNCKNSDSMEVTILPKNINSINTMGNCIFETITFSPELNFNSSQINSFSWYIDNIFHDNNFETSATFNDIGFHDVTLITADIESCYDTAIAQIEITAGPNCKETNFSIYIPNAFTPNGDGKNEIFKIEEDEIIKNVELQIYDRFGKIICNNNNWDGTSEGKNCSEGIYIYKISFLSYQTAHQLNGTIALIR